MLARIEKAVASYPKAMLFELWDRGYRDPFSILLACLVSIRTYDEVSLEVSLRLLKRASTPKALLKINKESLEKLLAPSTFRHQKAENMLKIARITIDSYDGNLPCTEEALLALPGVGPKCAHLVLGISCEQPWIGVDIHVHRVTNRWGYVRASTPERTEKALLKILPKEHWVRINALLVPFGKHICTGARPHCSICPVLEWCEQVGVKNPR